MSDTSVPFEREPFDIIWSPESAKDVGKFSDCVAEKIALRQSRDLQIIQTKLDTLLLQSPFLANDAEYCNTNYYFGEELEEDSGAGDESGIGCSKSQASFNVAVGRGPDVTDKTKTVSEKSEPKSVSEASRASSFTKAMGKRMSDMDNKQIRRREWDNFMCEFIGWKAKVSRSSIRRFRFLAVPPDNRLVRLVSNPIYVSIICVLVFANIVWIGYEADCSLRLEESNCVSESLATSVSIGFALIFLAEITLKIAALRWSFFFGRGWGMNALDLLLVISTALEMTSGTSVRQGRLLRALRMARVLRIIRIMSVFRPLRKIVCSLYSSAIVLVWSLIIMLGVIYIFSLIIMQALIDHLDTAEPQERQLLIEHFGNIETTMLTLFFAVSGGIDWYGLVPALRSVHYIMMYVIAFYVFTMVFGIMNVLIGVFCEAASEANAIDPDLLIHRERVWMNQTLERLECMFEEIDKDGDGIITWDEFREYAQDETVLNYLMSQGVNIFDASGLFQLLGLSSDGASEIDSLTFMVAMLSMFGQTRNTDLLMLKQEFRQTAANIQRMMYHNRITHGKTMYHKAYHKVQTHHL